MSRYELQGRADKAWVAHAVIGWDRPLNTFFAQVFSNATGEDEVAVWEGTTDRELPTPEAAIAVVEPFAIVPADMVEKLRRDFAEQPARSPLWPRLY